MYKGEDRFKKKKVGFDTYFLGASLGEAAFVSSFLGSAGFGGMVCVLKRSLMLSFGAPGAGGLTSVERPIRFAVRTTRSSTFMVNLRSSLPSRRFLLQNGHVLISASAPVAFASFMRSLATASARSGIPALTPPPAPQQRCSFRFLSISTSLIPGMLLRTFLGSSNTP